jgi:hypothetical protein
MNSTPVTLHFSPMDCYFKKHRTCHDPKEPFPIQIQIVIKTPPITGCLLKGTLEKFLKLLLGKFLKMTANGMVTIHAGAMGF